jgi:hypothetical protein
LDVLNAKDGQKGGIKANIGIAKDKKDKDKKATGRGKQAAASSRSTNQKGGKKGAQPVTETEQKLMSVVK